MFLNYASGRETGMIEPLTWTRSETTRRVFSIDLSKHRDFQKVHPTSIRCLDVDPIEGKYLLSGSLDGVIVIYDLETSLTSISHTHPMICTAGKSNPHCHKYSVEVLQWYPVDTGMFMSSSSDSLKIWDTNTLVAVDSFYLPDKIHCHHMSPVSTKHSLIAVGTEKSEVQLIDLRSGSSTHKLQTRGHRKAVMTVRWSTSEEYLLASGSTDSKVILWDVRSAKGSLKVLDQHNGDCTASSANSVNTAHDGVVNGILFTSDGLHLVTVGTDNRMRLWNSHTGKNMMVNYGKIDNDSKTCVKFAVSHNCDPEAIFIQDFSSSDIHIYDMWAGDKINTLRGHYNQVNAVVYNTDVQELYSAGSDRNLLVWIPQTGTESVYDDFMSERNQDKGRTRVNFTSRIAMQDAWSSDED